MKQRKAAILFLKPKTSESSSERPLPEVFDLLWDDWG